jgi:hypothetical protein
VRLFGVSQSSSRKSKVPSSTSSSSASTSSSSSLNSPLAVVSASSSLSSSSEQEQKFAHHLSLGIKSYEHKNYTLAFESLTFAAHARTPQTHAKAAYYLGQLALLFVVF